MQNLDEFVEKLTADKGISLSPEEKSKLKDRINDRVNNAVLSHLSEEQLQELSELVKDPSFDSAKMDEYFAKTDINIDEILKKETNDFRNEYLGGQNE